MISVGKVIHFKQICREEIILITYENIYFFPENLIYVLSLYLSSLLLFLDLKA